MKKLLLFFVSLGISLSINAQTETTGTVRGAVIDKQGNPLPGAIIKANGGAETVLAESDGTFVMEVPIWLNSIVASYPGMRDKKLKTDFYSPMLFKLKPDTKYAFVNFVGGLTIAYDAERCLPVFGVMGGTLDNWGMYGKLLLATNGEHYFRSPQAVLGFTKHIYKGAYGYLGVGYGGVYEHVDNTYSAYDTRVYDDWHVGAALDFGFIFKIGSHFDLGVGASITTDFDIISGSPVITLGYVWQ